MRLFTDTDEQQNPGDDDEDRLENMLVVILRCAFWCRVKGT